VVIGGAGYEALTAALLRTVIGALSEPFESVHAVLQRAVAAFHKSAVYTAFPGSATDKSVAGLIGLRLTNGPVMLFEYMRSVVTPVTTYKLAGEDIPPYDVIPRRAYRCDLSVSEALVLGIDIVEAAKATSVYVGGATRAVSLQPTGVVTEDPGKIFKTALHVAESSRLAGMLRLQAADHTVPDALFQRNLTAFCNSMTAVRYLYGAAVPPWQGGTLGDYVPPDDDDSSR
jgi:hypothetical protein